MREFDDFIQAISRIVPLNPAEIDALLPTLHYKEYAKKDLLTSEGDIENYIYFIADGGIRNYCIHNGEEYSLDFYFKGSFTNSYMSFILRERSKVYVEALFDSKVIRLHYNDVANLYRKSITFNILGRIITESLYVRRTKREFSFITQSAKERYEALLSENKELVQRIPQKYLASYLGVKAESLSRIRKLLSSK
jgi:CRP/FNR family transcriptional regulator, anaerobic regulatory protein